MQYIVIGLIIGIVVGIFIGYGSLYGEIKELNIHHFKDINTLQDELNYYRRNENIK